MCLRDGFVCRLVVGTAIIVALLIGWGPIPWIA